MGLFDFLGRSRPKQTPATASAPTIPSTAPAHPSAAQREMVRLALHSVLRQKGIPGNYLTCEVLPVHLAGQGEAVLVQLVVLKWHDALMRYAPALQQGLIEGLKQFDGNASATKYHFSWAFAPDCGNPPTQFPESSFWITTTAPAGAMFPPIAPPVVAAATLAAATAVAAPSATKPKFDLPPTAADLRKTGDEDDDDDHGFAATQINEM